MDLPAFRTLIALSEQGSLARVAESSFLTSAAIHKQLRSLESAWGVKLYERKGRRLQLTQPAILVLPFLRDAIASTESALAALEEWKGCRRGIIRLGAGPTLGSYLLPHLLKRFRRAHTKVDLVVETGSSQQLIERVVSGGIDLAFVVSSGGRELPALHIAREWRFESVIISNIPGIPAQCPLHALESFPFILSRQGSRSDALIQQYFARHNFNPRVTMRFDSNEALKSMVRLGLGLSVVPLWAIDEDLKHGHLSVIRQREPPLISSFALLSRSAGHLVGPVNAFVELAKTFVWKRPHMIFSGGKRPQATD